MRALCLLLIMLLPIPAQADPTPEFCQIIRAWFQIRDKKETQALAQKFCDSFPFHDGPCNTAENLGQALCMVSHEHQGFCYRIQNTGQGICSIGGIIPITCDRVPNVSQGICNVLLDSQRRTICTTESDQDTPSWLAAVKAACK